jgi:hypothetical protein
LRRSKVEPAEVGFNCDELGGGSLLTGSDCDAAEGRTFPYTVSVLGVRIPELSTSTRAPKPKAAIATMTLRFGI